MEASGWTFLVLVIIYFLTLIHFYQVIFTPRGRFRNGPVIPRFYSQICALNLSASSTKNNIRNAEVQHIAYLKVHKTASSTLFNIFYRFGQRRHLNFIVPQRGHILKNDWPNNTNEIVPVMANATYHIICVHAVFQKQAYEEYLPSDTVYIASIREPMERLVSAFWYYRDIHKISYLTKIGGSNPLKTFLSNPQMYEHPDVYQSVTNNTMAKDFGFSPTSFHNTTLFKEYLHVLDHQFDLVLEKSLFPESVVLMKRRLNWSLKDVLYINQNQYAHVRSDTEVSASMKKNANVLLKLDYMLYDFFLKRLKRELRDQDVTFWEEVINLKDVQKRVNNFCTFLGRSYTEKLLVVNATKWNDRFEISFCDCNSMMVREVAAVDFLRKTMEKRVNLECPENKYRLSPG